MNRFTVGQAEIHRVEELRTRMPMAMFNLADDVLQSHASWLYPHWADADGMWDMVVQSFIVIVDGRVVVIDPCVGNGRSLPEFAIFDMLDTPFIERFGATGIRPEDVDAVYCTHLHSDHCGWNTCLRDGRYVPTFPNARYYMARREVDRWDFRRADHVHVPANAGIFENSVLPILEAGLAEIVDGNRHIVPSLEIEPAPGHTAGHSVAHLTSGGKQAWFTGDAFHHPIEFHHPEIDARTCEDHHQTVLTRKRLIDRFIADGALIVPAHFADPHVGYLREENGVRRFEGLAT